VRAQATGIPRAFLETVDESDLTDGSVALPGGGFAKVRTNEKNFSDLAVAAEIDFDNDESMSPYYKCQLCGSVMVNAVSVPCCDALFCDKCVRKKLVTTNFHCPSCKKQISPDLLIPNRELRAEIEQAKRKRVAEVIAQRKAEQKVRLFVPTRKARLCCAKRDGFLFLFSHFSHIYCVSGRRSVWRRRRRGSCGWRGGARRRRDKARKGPFCEWRARVPRLGRAAAVQVRQRMRFSAPQQGRRRPARQRRGAERID
jgi:hypothetical protein